MPPMDPKKPPRAPVGKAPGNPPPGTGPIALSEEEAEALGKLGKELAARKQSQTDGEQASPEEVAGHDRAIQEGDVGLYLQPQHDWDRTRRMLDEANGSDERQERGDWDEERMKKAVIEAMKSLDLGTARADGGIELSGPDFVVSPRELTRLKQTALDGIPWDADSRKEHEAKRQKIREAFDLNGDGTTTLHEVEKAKEIFLGSLSPEERQRVQKEAQGEEYVNAEALYQILNAPPLPQSNKQGR